MHAMTSFVAAAIGAFALLTPATSQSLIVDLAPVPSSGGASSALAGPVAVNGQVFFTANGPWGVELYVSDGTPGGTKMVLDLGTNTSSSPMGLTALGNELLFSAEVAGLGRELWKTDGTAAGTVLLKDFAVGPANGSPHSFAKLGGLVYFSAYDGIGHGLWATDGTTSGTTQVISASAGPTQLTVSGSTLFFTLATVAFATELWKSDGTAAGTSLVADIEPVGSSSPTQLTPFQNGLLFRASRAGFGAEPYFTDGTPAGTVPLADLFVGGGSSNPSQFTVLGSNALFVANDSANPTVNELYATDGTPGGTSLIAAGLTADRLTAFQGHVYFRGTNTAGAELWRTDGSVAGTALYADISPSSSSPDQLTVIGSELWFSADDGSGIGREPWKTDGSANGAQLVRDANSAGSSVPHDMILLGGEVFCGLTVGSVGDEPAMLAIDGSTATVLADLQPATSSSNPDEFVAFPGGAFFTATSQAIGDEAFWTDGTAAGTFNVDVWAVANAGSVPRDAVVIGSEAFFSAGIGVDRELWKSDGSPFGTQQVSDPGGLVSTSPSALAAVNGRIVFRGLTAGNGFELMASDGTPAGTGLIKEITPGGSSTGIAEIVSNGTRAVFAAFDPVLGTELWSTDGTSAGTFLIDINVGGGSSSPQHIVEASGNFYFTASAGASRVAWVSDGTIAGTRAVSGSVTPLNPFQLTPSGDRVFGRGSIPGIGQELFVTDDTVGGTQGIDVAGGLSSSVITSLTGAANGAFFLFDDKTGSGIELWFTDGTTAGTAMVRDIAPGFAHGPVADTITPILGGSQVIFVASDLQHGLQLWTSDGTAAGTVMATNFGGDGVGAASFGEIFAASAEVFFAANDGSPIGTEPYSLETGLPFALAYGNGCAGPGESAPMIGSSGGAPAIGNATFAVDVLGASPASLAPLFFGFAPANASLGGTCRLLVALPASSLSVVITDASGNGSVGVPLPNDPSAIGASLFFQYAVVTPTGPFLDLLDLSNGLHVQVGN